MEKKTLQINFSSPLWLCVLLILMLSANNTLKAELNIDSLKQIWLNKSEPDSNRFKALNTFYINYTFSLPDSTISLTHYHETLAAEKGLEKEILKALDERALALCVLGQYDSALVHMNSVLNAVIDSKDTIAIAKTYNNIGNVYYYQNKFQEAVRYFTLSLGLHESMNILAPQADILNNLGLIYYEIKNLDLAFDYYNQALTIYEQLGDQEKMGNIWLNMAVMHRKNKDDEQAIQFNKKALKALQSINNQISIADSYYLFAEVFYDRNEMDSAFYYVDKSLMINRAIGNEIKEIESLILIGNLTLVNDVNAATDMAEEVLEMAKKYDIKSIMVSAYELLYKCYKSQNRYKLSLEMHESYINEYDSLLVEENNIKVIREAIQSEFEMKLFNTQLENEKVQAKLKLNQIKNTYSILLIGTVLIFLLLFYLRYRISAHQKQKETLLKEIEELKKSNDAPVALHTNSFELNRGKIEEAIDRKINDTDWKVLNVLLADPVTSNKEIANQIFLSVDGIGSSLRRMYLTFDIKESKYKKISLIMKAIKLSNQTLEKV